MKIATTQPFNLATYFFIPACESKVKAFFILQLNQSPHYLSTPKELESGASFHSTLHMQKPNLMILLQCKTSRTALITFQTILATGKHASYSPLRLSKRNISNSLCLKVLNEYLSSLPLPPPLPLQ